MKTIKYITITLFAIVAVLWGLALCGCKSCPECVPPGLRPTRVHDTIYVTKVITLHDTIYKQKTVNLGNVRDVYIGGGK